MTTIAWNFRHQHSPWFHGTTIMMTVNSNSVESSCAAVRAASTSLHPNVIGHFKVVLSDAHTRV